MNNLYTWAKRWNIPAQAVTELVRIMGVNFTSQADQLPGISEAAIQQRHRLESSKVGVRLWRNNNGATLDENGRMIRFGLGNDSAKVNQKMKSSDLIGITPIVINPAHVGLTFGVFTSIEVKAGSWQYKGTTREVAQFNWLKLVASMGGIARFSNNPDEWRT